jgi:hypothetical protein
VLSCYAKIPTLAISNPVSKPMDPHYKNFTCNSSPFMVILPIIQSTPGIFIQKPQPGIKPYAVQLKNIIIMMRAIII